MTPEALAPPVVSSKLLAHVLGVTQGQEEYEEREQRVETHWD